MLSDANGIIQRSERLYPTYGGSYNKSEHLWTFPSGARIYFGHMEHDGSELIYQGAEYSFIALDELTEFLEKQYLFMFTRCRPAAPGLRAYIRTATNPGNIGHRWVKKRFIKRDIVNRPRYFVHEKQHDGTMVDTEVTRYHTNEHGEPDSLSRAYYPALMGSNPHTDSASYRSRIRATGDPVQIARLEEGDWDAEYAEGLVYGTFNDDNVTSQADYNPDLPIYWACDDGYVYGDGPGNLNYHPRVVLFVQDNAVGGLNVFDEYIATGENHDITLTNLLGKPDGTLSDPPTRWQAYKRPEVAYVPGEAALFRGEVGRRGIVSVNGTHTVTEGIKTVRSLIVREDGERPLRVHPRCQNIIYEFGEYRPDHKNKSVTGELVPYKMDDHSCLIGDTLITTKRGDVPIQDVTSLDHVWTRLGWRRVLWSGQTGIKPVMSLTLPDGKKIIGTGDHPVFTANRGFVRLDALRYGDIMLRISEHKEYAEWLSTKQLSTKEYHLSDTPTRPIGPIESITNRTRDIFGRELSRCIVNFGRTISGLFQRGIMFITLMETPSITSFQTSLACQHQSITPITPLPYRQNVESKPERTSTAFGTWPQSGIDRKRGANGIASMAKSRGKDANPLRLSAITVRESLRATGKRVIASVAIIANHLVGAQVVSTTKHGTVFYAGKRLSLTNIPASKHAHVVAVQSSDGVSNLHPVYNLHIEGTHEYFANGVLVHNCDALRYLAYQRRHFRGVSS